MDTATAAALDLIDEERHMLIGDRPAKHHRCHVWGCEMPAMHIEAYSLMVNPGRLGDFVWGLCIPHFFDGVEAIATAARPNRGPYPWAPV